MEFADIAYEFFREAGYKCHIQPYTRLPSTAAKDATCLSPHRYSFEQSEFLYRQVLSDSAGTVRSVHIGMDKDRIIIALHPEEQLVLVHYRRYISDRDKKKLMLPSMHSNYIEDWQVLCPITNIDVLQELDAIVKDIHGDSLPKLKPRLPVKRPTR